MNRAILSCVAIFFAAPAWAADPPYKAGVATAVITPAEPMWMAGYAARNKPSEGKAQELYAKAIALEDAKGNSLILLTTDLIGLPRTLANAVIDKAKKETGLKSAQLMLTSSHTHSGPVLRENLSDMYDLSPAEAAKVEAYTKKLKDDLAGVMIQAFRNRKPARLSFGAGEAKFAVNRRQATEKGMTIGVNPDGPVDHSVPVLKVEAEGKVLAVAFGYACHNTTLDYYKWNGDYAGYAQSEIEKEMPGTVALFWMGCGGDANPNPRRTEEQAIRHGKELAAGVAKALSGPLTPVAGMFGVAYAQVDLPLGALPTKEQLRADLASKTFAVKTRAERLLKQWETKGKLMDRYEDYPVQTWLIGDKLVWTAFGGEVVIDYAIRLKKEMPLNGRTLWVTAYANDVMAYIPSARVLKEGGYEADTSMIYYGLPTRWSPAVEDIIVNAAIGQLKSLDGIK